MSEILVCRSLRKRYGGTLALNDVELSIESGRIVGLLGPNGSGKTTLIKLANGLLQPSQGEILIGGMAPGPGTKALVSYLPDTDYLPDYMSLGSLVKLFADFYPDFDRAKALEMLHELDLSESARLKTLSKGNREKTQLVLTMSRRARLYLLDEPIGGVDPAARDYILRTIIGNYAEDAAVVISTHLIADVEPVLDDVVFLKKGGVLLHQSAESLRDEQGKSVDAYFREVFAC
ncbi:MAG: ABC transporter ATP-binding protein [Oscillospiraceae bacterium]